MKKFNLNITKFLNKKISSNTNVLIEPKSYSINNEISLQSPSSINGVNLFLPFSIGAFSHINPNGHIQNCTIGKYCAIATGVKIGNGNHPTNWLSVNACQYVENFRNYNNIFENRINIKSFDCYKHTTIGNDVWIGANVYIKDGVTIGDGAIIGANSVVTKDVEPYAIMAGAPAKLIRYRFSPEIIKELQELKWWEYNIADFGDVDFDNIEKAIEQLKEKLPKLQKYQPKVVDFKYLANLVTKEIRILFGLIKITKSAASKKIYVLGKLIKEKKKMEI